MLILVLAVLCAGLAVLLLWWSRRGRLSSTPARIVGSFGVSLLLIGGAGCGVFVWAVGATDSSQLARSLVWGESGFGDQDRFASRSIRAAVEPFSFTDATSDSPVANYVDDEAGTALAEILEATDTTSFIVIHGEDLLYEEYFNGSSHEAVQTSFSVAKSFTATLVGIAIDEGLIAGLDDPVTDYISELTERDSRFEEITLRHLITMSSGLSFDDGGWPWDDPANTYHGTDLRSAALARPRIETSPGVVFDYNDWNVILLGVVLERATGMSVSQYMETRLWQPMGAEAAGSWSLDSERHGFEKMFVGVNGRAIDFAKLGWLYLREGRNEARQVVSSQFVADATRGDRANDPAAGYRYLWWLDQERDAYYAAGDHGQFIYVDPAVEVVIVRNGRNGDHDWVELFGNLVDWLEPQLTGP